MASAHRKRDPRTGRFVRKARRNPGKSRYSVSVKRLAGHPGWYGVYIKETGFPPRLHARAPSKETATDEAKKARTTLHRAFD